MPCFRKHHTCPCGRDWCDEMGPDRLCNDRCPTCDAEIEPDEHEAIQGAKSAKIRTLNDHFRKSLTGGRVMMTAAVSGLLVCLRYTFNVAPSGMTPSSTKRHRAIANLLARATMPTLRPRIPIPANRSRHQSDSLLFGW